MRSPQTIALRVSMVIAMLVGIAHRSALAQVPFPPGADGAPTLVYLIQGERRALTDDFVAQLDGDSLKISLETSGLINAGPDDGLLVSLVQPAASRQDERPNSNGQVVFSNVQQGLAALVVTADGITNASLTSLYAALPVFVTSTVAPAAGGAEPAAAAAPTQLSVPIGVIPPSDLVQDLNNNVESPTPDADVMESKEFEYTAPSRFQVQRLADGSVQGKVVVPQRGYLSVPGATKIAFYRDGQLVAEGQSSNEGDWVVKNVPAGINTLMATGAAGHVSYNVEVMDAPVAEVADGRKPTIHMVAARRLASDSLMVPLIPPALMDDVRKIVDERMPGSPVSMPPGAGAGPAAGAPAGGGFPGGGFGGGFGGGGAGGGFGGAGIAGAAALAAGAAAIAASNNNDNRNGNIFVPPIATQIVP